MNDQWTEYQFPNYIEKKTLVFTNSADSCFELAKRLKSRYGEKSLFYYVHENMKNQDTYRIIQDFIAGKVNLLIVSKNGFPNQNILNVDENNNNV